jgi:hypothetical protein
MQNELGKILIIVGVLFLIFGLVLTSKLHIPWLGKLPGDIQIKRDNFHFYFPIATSILLSLLLSLILYFFRKKSG